VRVILLLDNYDSFTWNVVQALWKLGADVRVERNDALSVDEVLALRASAIVLSPGPGEPRNAGIMPELLRRMPDSMPLLGICLGHQALVEHFGGDIERDPVPVHGKSSLVHHTRTGIFSGLPDPLEVGRYHSLRARRSTLPPELSLTAWTDDGVVMAVEHATRPWHGVQFHPESILTPLGERLMANFLRVADGSALSSARPAT
jgi:anthranilate synthase component 2